MRKKHAAQTAPTPSWKSVILLAITALALSTASAFAATTKWTFQGTASWFDPANWDNGLPTCDPPLDAQINNGGTARISTLTPLGHAHDLTLGVNPGESGNVSVIMGDLNICGDVFVGYRASGVMTISGGGGVSTNGNASIASLTSTLWTSNGSVAVDGSGSTWTITGEGDVGGTTTSAGGTGLLTVTNSGEVTAASVRIYPSGTLAGNGTVTVNSGSGTATVDGTLAPSGTLTISGNLSFGTLANMRCNVTSTSWDRAEVSRTATLNGKLSVTLNGFFTGDFPLLHASTLSGQFSSYSFTYTGCLSPSIVYDRVNGYVYLHVESTCQ